METKNTMSKEHEPLIKMAPIIGGTFDHYKTKITVDNFFMGITQVTQGQWESVMGTSWPGDGEIDTNGNNSVPNADLGEGKDFPAYFLNWYDAIEFCNALSEKENLEKVYTIDKATQDKNNKSSEDPLKWTVIADFSKNGYRLPTKAEWEYAAGHGGFNSNGTAKNRYIYAGTSETSELEKYAWYCNNNENQIGTKTVGTKKPNGIGLYDMCGNVSDWCWDWEGEYETNKATNPTGASSGSERITHGGAWNFSAALCHVRFNFEFSANKRLNTLGFRVVRSSS